MSNKNKPAQNMEGLPILPGIVQTAAEPAGEVVIVDDGTLSAAAYLANMQPGGAVSGPTTAPALLAEPFVAIIEAPLASIDPNAFIPVRERLETKEMSRKQSIALKRLHRGLEDTGARLEDGSLVTRPAQAVRWLLEQIYNASVV